MQIRVDLGGVSLPWRFRDTTPFERWLQERPWADLGGILTVRTSGSVHASLLADQLLWQQGLSDVHITTGVPAPSDKEGFPIVSSIFEISEAVTRREALTKCAEELRRRPTLVVANASELGYTVAQRLSDELEQVREGVNKLPNAAGLAVVVLIGPAAASSPTIDLTQGAPVLDLGWASRERENEVWEQYSHARLAWEAGGDLDRAYRLREDAEAVPAFNDASLESALNTAASAIQSGLSQDDNDTVSHALESGDWEPLLDRRLAWRPLGVGHARPAPWLARALLRGGASGGAAPVLCSSIVCVPVAQAVMTRCLDLEALVRSRFANRTDEATEEAQSAYHRFRDGSHSDRRFYPNGSPVLPHVSPWSFANFGDFLRGLGLRDRSYRMLKTLRELRNSVMHGHYVCYHTLLELRTIEQYLARGLQPNEPEVYRMVRTGT